MRHNTKKDILIKQINYKNNAKTFVPVQNKKIPWDSNWDKNLHPGRMDRARARTLSFS